MGKTVIIAKNYGQSLSKIMGNYYQTLWVIMAKKLWVIIGCKVK